MRTAIMLAALTMLLQFLDRSRRKRGPEIRRLKMRHRVRFFPVNPDLKPECMPAKMRAKLQRA